MIGRCEKTKELEEVIAKATNAKEVVVVGSGRAAIAFACQALGFTSIQVPTYSSDDLMDAPIWGGARPIPYDIDGNIEDAIVVHPYHFRQSGRIIHDFAHIWPKDFDVGNDIAIFSFGPLKPITGGHGGAIACNFKLDRHKLENMSPISDMNSSLILSQLKRPPPEKRYIRVNDFDTCQQYFSSKGITVRHETGGLVHRMMGLSDERFPKAVKRWNTVVSIPNYPDLTNEERKLIDDACRRYSV